MEYKRYHDLDANVKLPLIKAAPILYELCTTYCEFASLIYEYDSTNEEEKREMFDMAFTLRTAMQSILNTIAEPYNWLSTAASPSNHR